MNDNELFQSYGEESQYGADNDLVKALQAQEGETDIANLQGGGALQPQSLEATLAMLTFQEKHLKLWKDITKIKAFSTLEEYSIQDGYGSEGGFVGQLENPDEGDPDFRREFAVVKYIRDLWRTSDVLTHAKTITSAEMKNKQAAMMRSLRTWERTMFFGDSAIIPQSFDGILKTVETNGTVDHVIDMRGSALNENIMRQAAELISVNYGTATDMYLSPGVQTSIDSILFDAGSQRYNQEAVSSNSGLIGLGNKVTQMVTSFGNFNFKPDIFIRPEVETVPKIKDSANPKNLVEGATSPKAPAMPSFVLSAQPATVPGSLWAASGSGGAVSGTYGYRVAAVNQYGKSQAAAAATETSVDAGSITVTITPGGGASPATGFIIYREATPGTGIYLKMKEVANSGQATTVHVDLNVDLPGTSVSFLLDNTSVGEDRSIAFSQLAPMHSVEYAKIGPYRWGTVNMYGVPKYYAPLKYVVFKNVGIKKGQGSPIFEL